MTPDEVDLWLYDPRETTDTAPLEGLLSAGERTRHARFQHPRDRHDFLISRSLLRTTLSRYEARPPEAWRFTTGPHGKPEIEGDAGNPRLRFNLSHTQGLILVGVTRGHDIGVDVEDIRQETDALSLAERFFSPEEHEQLASLAPEDRSRHFFALWTLKEAYAKARGEGLSLPLDTCRFRFDGPEVVPDFIDDDATAWQLHRFSPTPHHVAAAAVRRPPELPAVFTVRRARTL
ncbi:MAG: 4'-phosphopantetheinyl transferase superfamily protein [Deltaproteobacteria bacterium]|nr:4'-phosphopantetheinyl transferase superfamily protein [Deltaproteobacteria bacterium]